MGSVEVLVVDDGSTDATAAIVADRLTALAGSSAQLRLLRRPHAGKGAAVQAGMLDAQSEFILFADADLATPPDQLPLLTEALAEHDIALGSRVHPDGSDRRRTQPFHRRLLGRVFHSLAARWVTGPVPDTQCGFKGFRRAAAHDLFEPPEDRWHRLRRRDHPSCAAARLFDRDRAGAVVGQAWLSDASPAGAGAASRNRSDPDPADSSKRAASVTGARVGCGDSDPNPTAARRICADTRGTTSRLRRDPALLLGTTALKHARRDALLALDVSPRLVGRLRRRSARGVSRRGPSRQRAAARLGAGARDRAADASPRGRAGRRHQPNRPSRACSDRSRGLRRCQGDLLRRQLSRRLRDASRRS